MLRALRWLVASSNPSNFESVREMRNARQIDLPVEVASLESSSRIKQHKNYPLFALKLIVSGGLLAWIFIRADLTEFSDAVTRTNLWFYGLSLPLMAIGLWVRSCKWKVLLSVQNAEVPLRDLLSLTYISMFLNNFFLGTLGGDAYRVYRTAGLSPSTSAALSPVLMDRITGFFAALWIVLLVGSGFLLGSGELVRIELLFVLAAMGAVVAVLIVAAIVYAPRVVALPILNLSPKIHRIAQNVSDSLMLYRHRRGIVVTVIGLSLLFHFVQTAAVYLFTLAAGGKVSVFALLFISPLVGLLVMIPISLNGLGIQEGSYVFYLEKVGLSGAQALLVAVLARAAILLVSLVGAWLLLFRRRESRR